MRSISLFLALLLGSAALAAPTPVIDDQDPFTVKVSDDEFFQRIGRPGPLSDRHSRLATVDSAYLMRAPPRSANRAGKNWRTELQKVTNAKSAASAAQEVKLVLPDLKPAVEELEPSRAIISL